MTQEQPYDRLPEQVKEVVLGALVDIAAKPITKMSDTRPLMNIWNTYKLGKKQDVNCWRCHSYVLHKFKEFTNFNNG